MGVLNNPFVGEFLNTIVRYSRPTDHIAILYLTIVCASLLRYIE